MPAIDLNNQLIHMEKSEIPPALAKAPASGLARAIDSVAHLLLSALAAAPVLSRVRCFAIPSRATGGSSAPRVVV
jgi:hypothetical protein